MVLLPAFNFSDADLHDFLDQGDGERLVERKVNGAFRGGERLQIVFEGFDHGGGGKEAAVVGEGTEPDENFFMSEGRDAVADDFGRFFR
jgi:hypothetical protein